ncbi:MAG: heme lyase CcmF/NrfE family subunit [Calditrichaceae bacterium]|nr:heme lyase CcmF/NrfE family subunit [Calditrichaceae bacterium]
MNIGSVSIVLSFIATLFSSYYYFHIMRSELKVAVNKKTKKNQSQEIDMKNGRISYYIGVGLIIAASAFLFYLFITYQFQYKYVYGYSSRDLPLGFLISSFWAGQEGSFLFWTLMNALLGIIFIKTSKNYEATGMFFFSIIQLFFLTILIKASPFSTYNQTPPDGSGLNPLLQNFWMVIHPPILFVGYAAAAFPFILAIASLIKKEFDSWIKYALPWTVFTSLTLGAGIILGAFWAYETLGWGGYWGWDPVENSSLIPWLTVLALLHSLLVQNMKGSLKKTNYFLSIITFILVIYATFLTRSGVLSDFSVHSFADLGINSFLIIFMVVLTAFGIGIFFNRLKSIPLVSMDTSVLNKENGLGISVIVFSAMALLTFVGTSSPILSGFFGDPSQVDISFYNKMNLWPAILMALLLGVIPFLTWIEHNTKEIIKKLAVSLTLTVISIILSIYLGITTVSMIIFAGMAAFAFWTNILVAISNRKKGWQQVGAPIAHIGVGMILMAIVVSGLFDESERIVLEKDKPESALGYNLLYKGLVQKPDGKDVVTIEVSNGNEVFHAKPRLFYNDKTQGMMREPDVKSGILVDLYVSPLERRTFEETAPGHSLIIMKGETKLLDDYAITFVDFKMASHSDNPGAFSIGAELAIAKGGQQTTIIPVMIITGKNREYQAIHIGLSEDLHSSPTVALTGVNADSKTVQLMISGLPGHNHPSGAKPEQLLVEISKKPFMNILWAGSIILLLGVYFSLHRRMVQLIRKEGTR